MQILLFSFFFGTEKPSKPIAIQQITATSTSMQLSWTPGYDGNLPITEYTLQIKDVNFGSWATHSVVGTNMFIVRKLRPNGRYMCRVRAHNKLGYGQYSETEILSTHEEGNKRKNIYEEEQKDYNLVMLFNR